MLFENYLDDTRKLQDPNLSRAVSAEPENSSSIRPIPSQILHSRLERIEF
jgi:hypothetical protein